MTFGLNPFWLWVPRLLMAILAVGIFNLVQQIKKALSLRTING
jgi:hypothetical protein